MGSANAIDAAATLMAEPRQTGEGAGELERLLEASAVPALHELSELRACTVQEAAESRALPELRKKGVVVDIIHMVEVGSAKYP